MKILFTSKLYSKFALIILIINLTTINLKANNMNETVLEKFLRYVKIDTQSKENSPTYPSTTKQFDLLNLLVKELNLLGLQNVTIDKYGYVTATLPSNQNNKIPVIGFLAHVDTSPEVSGTNVKPQVINYVGGDITLTGNPNIIIKQKDNPDLQYALGKTIVTSDGTTLLGADNKAGIAIIMTALQTLINNPQIPHGEIKIGFTPDEEIGAGTKYFDIKKFGAEFAYTVDGDAVGEINKETFSADACIITAYGIDMHPGKAKDKMINSIKIISEIITRLPKNIAPETTDNYEPYIHPYVLEGGVDKSTVKLLFRDFETQGLVKLKNIVDGIISEIKKIYPNAKITVEVNEQYRNMKEGIAKDERVTEYLYSAVKQTGLEPKWVPVRGGTDGSKLTANGLPTPNIFTGGYNYHSLTEWANVWGMEKSVETVINLVKIWASNK